MQVGVCRLTFRLHGNDSLKGKRQVAHSLIPKLRQRFKVAAAEVDAQDEHQRLVVGIACVSNGNRHANEVLDNVLDYVQGCTLMLSLWTLTVRPSTGSELRHCGCGEEERPWT